MSFIHGTVVETVDGPVPIGRLWEMQRDGIDLPDFVIDVEQHHGRVERCDFTNTIVHIRTKDGLIVGCTPDTQFRVIREYTGTDFADTHDELPHDSTIQVGDFSGNHTVESIQAVESMGSPVAMYRCTCPVEVKAYGFTRGLVTA